MRNIHETTELVTTAFPLDGTDLVEELAIKYGHHVDLATHVELMPQVG